MPGLGSGEETAVAAAVRPAADERAGETAAPDADSHAGDSDARFDAARDRLRSKIEPPPPDDAG
ncbi:MAG: hypothetical protein Q8K79_07695 [Solirubrobacteraceae bacterium]|nr:hypothetical protein [Solirubrobacteraceae bacterium]